MEERKECPGWIEEEEDGSTRRRARDPADMDIFKKVYLSLSDLPYPDRQHWKLECNPKVGALGFVTSSSS